MTTNNLIPLHDPKVPPSNLTDKELIAHIRDRYPRLGPTLGVLLQRFEDGASRMHDCGTVSFPGFEPAQMSCPHCGSQLKLAQ